MMIDVDQAAKAMRDEEMQAEIEDFLEGFNQPTYRGMRVNGQRGSLAGHSSTGGPGIRGRTRNGFNESYRILVVFRPGVPSIDAHRK
jgi:hypothetical protein